MLSIPSRCGSALQSRAVWHWGAERLGWGAVLCITTRHCLGFTLLQNEHCKAMGVHLPAWHNVLPLLCDHLGLWKGTNGILGLGVAHCSRGNTRAAGQGCPCLPTSLQHCCCSVVLQARASRACGCKTQYPTDVFLLPVLLQVISDDERERGNHFYLTFSLCWVNPEEDDGTQ